VTLHPSFYCVGKQLGPTSAHLSFAIMHVPLHASEARWLLISVGKIDPVERIARRKKEKEKRELVIQEVPNETVREEKNHCCFLNCCGGLEVFGILLLSQLIIPARRMVSSA
jgi:hypothetical protein